MGEAAKVLELLDLEAYLALEEKSPVRHELLEGVGRGGVQVPHPKLPQALAQGDLGGELGQGDPDGLGDEGHGAACAGVGLEDVDLLP